MGLYYYIFAAIGGVAIDEVYMMYLSRQSYTYGRQGLAS